VRELVIVLTDLYFAGSEAAAATAAWRGRLPGIEHAGRFGQRTRLTSGWRDWLAIAAGREDLAGVAPARIAAAVLAPAPGTTSWLATPVHLSAGLSQVHLDHRGLLRLAAPDAAALAAAFAREFAASGLELLALPAGEFILRAAGMEPIPATEPARCAGGEIAAALPQGRAAAGLRRTSAEIEMWLHTQGGLTGALSPPARLLNALWLWGASGRDAALSVGASGTPRQAYGEDAWLCGLWHLQGGHCQALPPDLHALPAATAAVLTLRVADELNRNMQLTFLEALRSLDERFISPALERLRAGALERVVLIGNDNVLTLGRRSPLRRWRRPVAGLGGFA
jgi:hypothetical protein